MSAVIEMLKKVDNQLRRDVFNNKKYEKNGRVELTISQEMKPFDKKLVPDDCALACPYCKHNGTLNFQEGSEKIIEKNRKKGQ